MIRKMPLFLCLIGSALTTSFAAQLPAKDELAIQEKFSYLSLEPGAVVFTPPQGWVLADPQALPPNVSVMVVGKGTHEYPPSLNLATEQYSGSLKQYLKIVKSINESKGDEWKDLGTIRTEAGDASLSQVDLKSKWGYERLMHLILVKNGTAYILTAAALKDEFPKFYKDFFNAMKSLRINQDAFGMISDPSRRNALQKNMVKLKQAWKEYNEKFRTEHPSEQISPYEAFESGGFYEKYWVPFKAMLERDFSDMGPAWQKYVLGKMQNEMVK